MGVSKNSGTPKWMVYFMENPIKMDDLGVFPLFLETPISGYNSICNDRFGAHLRCPSGAPGASLWPPLPKCSHNLRLIHATKNGPYPKQPMWRLHPLTNPWVVSRLCSSMIFRKFILGMTFLQLPRCWKWLNLIKQERNNPVIRG